MKKHLLATVAAAAMAIAMHAGAQAGDVTPGKALDMVLLPKFLGILPFDQAHQGALEAEKELKNSKPLQYLGPTPENSAMATNCVASDSRDADEETPAVFGMTALRSQIKKLL